MQISTDMNRRTANIARLVAVARQGVLVTAVGLTAALAGCSGRASIHAMPFMRKDIAPTEPIAETVEADQAYWWLGEGGTLNVSLRRQTHSFLGKSFEKDYLFSLVLEGLPAGSEKLYRLNRDSVRQRCSNRGVHHRSMSVMGVVVVETPKDKWLKGRFHVVVRRQQFSILTGWAPRAERAPLTVLAGTFEAVRDPMRGQAVRDRTERDGFGRRGSGSAASMPDSIRWLPASQPSVSTKPAK